MEKLWVALLLLLSTLSSQPLGSMEQAAPQEPLAPVSALPLARAPDGAALQRAAPDGPDPADRLPAGAAPTDAVRVEAPARPAALRPGTALPDPRSSPPERLPYFATPPPARAPV